MIRKEFGLLLGHGSVTYMDQSSMWISHLYAWISHLYRSVTYMDQSSTVSIWISHLYACMHQSPIWISHLYGSVTYMDQSPICMDQSPIWTISHLYTIIVSYENMLVIKLGT